MKDFERLNKFIRLSMRAYLEDNGITKFNEMVNNKELFKKMIEEEVIIIGENWENEYIEIYPYLNKEIFREFNGIFEISYKLFKTQLYYHLKSF